MKKLFLTLSIVSIVFLSYAQKVDLDKSRFTFQYRDLPRSPLAAEFKTFSVNINASSAVKENYSDTGLEDAVNIQGWKKVPGKTGHLIVNVSLGDLIINSSQVLDRVDIKKDKDGKETGRTYYYWVDVNYSWKGNTAVVDFKNNAITSIGHGSEYSQNWKSSEYGSRKEAADYFNNNRLEIKGKLIRDHVNTALADVTSSLSNNYGYSVRKDFEILWILDSKKHPELPMQTETWTAFNSAIATVTPESLSDETKAKLNDVIKYFDAIPGKYATDDKGDKKLRYASFYNKAKIYLFLDSPEAAIKEAESLIANGYDEGDGKRLKKEAEDLMALFKKNNTNTRHFVIDLSAVVAPTAGN